MEINNWLNFIINIATVIGLIFLVYNTFKKPQERNEVDIEKMEIECQYKHRAVDEKFAIISQELSSIKENHLFHIENDIRLLQEGQVKLFTTLEERLPRPNK